MSNNLVQMNVATKTEVSRVSASGPFKRNGGSVRPNPVERVTAFHLCVYLLTFNVEAEQKLIPFEKTSLQPLGIIHRAFFLFFCCPVNATKNLTWFSLNTRQLVGPE